MGDQELNDLINSIRRFAPDDMQDAKELTAAITVFYEEWCERVPGSLLSLYMITDAAIITYLCSLDMEVTEDILNKALQLAKCKAMQIKQEQEKHG